jgi:ATP-dependent DNA helicase Q1
VTILSWKILKVLQEVEKQDGRVTLNQLADLVRGWGGGQFGGEGAEGKKEKSKGKIDLAELIGTKITLTKEVIHLLLSYSNHLTLSF